MAQIWHRRKNRSANADYKELILVARDGIEPPPPAFSGLRSAGHQQNTKRKKKDKPKRPGRKTGEGPFARRAAPPSGPSTPPAKQVPVTVVRCPCCGGELRFERVDEVSNTDIPAQPEPEIRRYAVEVFRCQA